VGAQAFFMGDKSTKAKKSKLFKFLVGLGILLVIYTVAGFFVVPAIIKSQMLKQLPTLTKRQAAIEQVKFNPYVLSLTIRGFSLKETTGEVFTSFDEFYANFQLWDSLFKRSWVFDEISLKKPFAQVTFEPDGNFNFANLLTNTLPDAKSKPPKSQGLPSVIISRLMVTNGTVAFADLNRKEPFRTAFEPIDLNLTEFTTIRDRNSPYKFFARTGDGETFGWAGTISVNPLRSVGTFRVGGVPLKKYSPYSHNYARCEIVNGIFDIGADYNYDSLTNALNLSVSNAAVHLSNLEIKSPDTGETVVSIPIFSVTQTEADVARMNVRVGLVKSSGGSILVRQNQDGTINLLSLLNPPTPKSEPSTHPTASSLPPFSAKIDEVAFDNYTIKAEDKKPAKAASFTIVQVGFNVKNVSNASNAPVTLAASLRFQETGYIGVGGTATLLPPTADLQLGLTNLDLRSVQPYVQEQIKLAITSGGLNLHGRARYASPDANAPLISFAGDMAITNFATADDVLFKDFAKWDALNIDGINVQMQPDKLQIEQVKFTGLNTSLIVGPDHRANLQTILRDQIAAKSNAAGINVAAETVPASQPKKMPEIALGALVFENASVHFADQSIEPHCTFDVEEFDGSIKGLSSKDDTTAIVDMNGKVGARSPFIVSGKINPLSSNIFADVTVTFTNTELTAFTPYTEKFAGRPLQKGKVSFAIHYLVDKKALKAENGFYVDQLTLGPKNNSPDATSLPVKLAIALLKDRHGRISLDVPLSGRIDDPKFRVGPIIWQVVMNLMTKAATSPFSLLGSMFGGGEELSFVEFQPGLAVIPDAETNKLNTLKKALYERPELTLEINGSVDPEVDRAPLAKTKFEQQLKSIWIKELTDAGKPALAIDQVQIDSTNRERLIKIAYQNTIGKFEASPSPTNQPPPSPTPEELRATKQAKQERLIAALADAERRERGAGLLIGSLKPIKISATKEIPVQPAKTIAVSAPSQPAGPELVEMENQLLQKIQITEDDFRELMKQRAASVHSYLSQGASISADRLFITAPKPISGSAKGTDRVNMTLD
jgi:uncharacterized protein involved in outer membrane biogenesis